MTRSLTAVLAASFLTLPGTAWACGGFFCNTTDPVDQSAEEILFSVNKDDAETTMHIKIMYEGPAEEFAWVVPVSGVPDLGLGSDATFSTLRQLGAQFYLERDAQGECEYWYSGYDLAASSSTSTTGGGGVQVIETGVVGPYETVILQADSSAALSQWLTDNDYDIPPGFDPVLAPYVAADSSFVALKLAKDKDTGDLAPLVLTYPGTTPTIPIQLTSVAATPDMRLRVYVLGDHRAVPESYLHVQLNHMAIDWWQGSGWWYGNGSSNYEEVVGLAADEAGGHAFATDFAGSPESLVGQLWRDGNGWSAGNLAMAADAYEFLERLIDGGYPADDALRNVLNAHIPVPAGLNGVSDTELYNCPSCYEQELRAAPFDAVAAADDVETYVLAPRRDADLMFQQYDWISRMTSSVSPAEMTVDPVFVFNPDMGGVDQLRTAWETALCFNGNSDVYDAPRRFRVADGRSVILPSMRQLDEMGMTELEYISDLAVPAAAIIERTSSSGQPEVLVDNTPGLAEKADEFNNEHGNAEDPKGCGCTSAPMGPAGLLPLLIAAALVRRRDDW